VFLKHGWSQALRRRLPAGYDALLRYGIETYENLFAPRQLLIAFEYVDAMRNAVGEMMRIGMSENQVNALACYLGFFLMEMVEGNNRLCHWEPDTGRCRPSAVRSPDAFPGTFIERSPHGMMDAWLNAIIPKIEAAAAVPAAARVYCGDCTNLLFGDNFFDAVVTDPPNYSHHLIFEELEFSWIWENMIHELPASAETPRREWGHREDGSPKANDRHRVEMLHSFKEIYRVLKPGHRLCLFVHSIGSSNFQEYLDLCNQAGLSLVDVKAVKTWIDGDSSEFRVQTCLVNLRKPHSLSVREVLQVADASVILDSVAVGISDADLAAVKDAVQALPYVEVRHSTSGVGLHLYCHLDGIPTANHTEHAALARCILGMMSSECNFDFSSRIDACGGNMWIHHTKATGTSGFELIKAATKTLTTSDLPANWRDHIAVVTRQRTRIKIDGIADNDPFDALASSRRRVPLDATHKAVIDELSRSGLLCESGVLVDVVLGDFETGCLKAFDGGHRLPARMAPLRVEHHQLDLDDRPRLRCRHVDRHRPRNRARCDHRLLTAG
jgi:hypothetical protein